MYTIPRNLKEEVKIFDKPFALYIKDIATAGVTVGFFWTMSSFVHSWLIVPYWIFAVLSTIYLVLPAGKVNPKKRRWQSLYYTLICDKSVYRSLDPISVKRGEKNVLEE